MAEYTCRNYGACEYADKRQVFKLSKSLACPNCGRREFLRPALSSAGTAPKSSPSAWKIALPVVLVASLAAAGYLWTKPPTKPPAALSGGFAPAPPLETSPIAPAPQPAAPIAPAPAPAMPQPTPPIPPPGAVATTPTDVNAMPAAVPAATPAPAPPTTIPQNPPPAPASPATAPAPSADPKLFAVIEIGGKGVKGMVLDLTEPASDKADCNADEEAFAECYLSKIKSVGPFNVNPINRASIPDTAQAAKDMMGEMAGILHVDPDHIYVVGSSSVKAVGHKAELQQAVESSLGSKPMDFIDSEEEARYAFSGILSLIPMQWRSNPNNREDKSWQAVVLDIGSGNTKGAYQELRGKNKYIETFELKWGSKTYSDEVDKQLGQNSFIDTSKKLRYALLRPAVKELVGRKPGMVNKRDRVYLIGGIGWALKTFTQPGNRQHFPVILPQHIDNLYRRAIAPNATSRLCQDNPDRPIEPDIDKICVSGNAFTVDNLIAGMDFLKSFSEAMKFQEKKVFFMSDSLYAWPLGYLRHQCEKDKKCPKYQKIQP